jgi:hypothetical protein
VFVVVGKMNVEDFRGKKQVTKKLRPANRYTVNKKSLRNFVHTGIHFSSVLVKENCEKYTGIVLNFVSQKRQTGTLVKSVPVTINIPVYFYTYRNSYNKTK